MADWIKFVESTVKDGRKTKVWAVWTKDGQNLLGRIGWYSPWRRYAFVPSEISQVIMEQDCLRQIADFIESGTEVRKTERKMEKEITT